MSTPSKTREDYLSDTGFDWTNVSQDDINQIFALCDAVKVVEGQDRDPFLFTANSGSWMDPGGHWLVLNVHIQANWHIGDNVGYPSRALRIRKVNHLMKDYIIKHFEVTPNPDISPAVPLGGQPTIQLLTPMVGPSGISGATQRPLALPSSASGARNPTQGSSQRRLSADQDQDQDSDPDGTETTLLKVTQRMVDYRVKHKILGMSAPLPIHVGGTAGTGKTAFSLFLLHCLLEEFPQHAFVYRHGDVNPGCFLYFRGTTYFHSSIVSAFSNGLLMRLLTSNSRNRIWTILDGAAAIPTGTSSANLIVLTSPGLETVGLKQFRKRAHPLVNPPWSLKDIEYIRDGVYPHLKKEDVAAAFSKWGGIPRILLDYANLPFRQITLRDSILVRKPARLFAQVGLALVDHLDISGIHFHLIPGQKLPDNLPNRVEAHFMYPAYCWATTWIQERFWEELKNRGGERDIMQFLLNPNHTSVARAFAFEPHVFRTIQNHGIYGRVKLLDGAGVIECKPLKVDPLERITFSRFSDIPTAPPGCHVGKFYVPSQTNHTSVDFYIPDIGLLGQITVGQKHGVKRQGLEAALASEMFDEWRLANPGRKLRLVFLCDKFNFDDFKKQPYLTTGGTTLKIAADILALDNQFEQLSWELDVEKQLRAHLRGDVFTKKEIVERHNASDWSAKLERLDYSQDQKAKRAKLDKGKGILGEPRRHSTRASLISSKRSYSELASDSDDDDEEFHL